MPPTGGWRGGLSLDVGGPVELLKWRSASTVEAAPMWVSPTQPRKELEEKATYRLHRKPLNVCTYNNNSRGTLLTGTAYLLSFYESEPLPFLPRPFFACSLEPFLG